MILQPLLAVGFLMHVVAVIFVLSALSLVLVVLIQKGKGGGLSGAFGGGAAGNILGSKTGDFLTWFTIGLVATFLLLSVVMAKYYRPSVSQSPTAQTPASMPAQTEQPQIPLQTVDNNSEENKAVNEDVALPSE
ncbi:MAG: preprotein translocase subunit SecG [Phycisphaerae bacterium]|nr:preprotein translocase subunit SecG [Phycisphaerae bacterium]